jgi:hypothetical protein
MCKPGARATETNEGEDRLMQWRMEMECTWIGRRGWWIEDDGVDASEWTVER